MENENMENKMKSFKNLGIKKYCFVATLDKYTCEKCGILDQQLFDIEEAVIGVNCPPMHKDCRCTITPVTRNKKVDTRWFRNPTTGKGEIGSYQTYKDFKKDYLDK